MILLALVLAVFRAVAGRVRRTEPVPPAAGAQKCAPAPASAPPVAATPENLAAGAEVARRRTAAAARAPWCCWACIPQVDADLHDTGDDGYGIRVVTAHSAGCIAAAEWFFHDRPEAPPGPMPVLYQPIPREGDR